MNATVKLCVPLLAFVLLARSASADCVSKALDGLENGEPSSAVGVLKRGGRRGDVRCKYILGMWTLSGTGLKQDYAAALRLLKEAAGAGLPVAQANLGVLYATGIGVERSEETAAAWYHSAAERGDALGQVSLGAAHFLGVGVEKDLLLAYKWTRLAAGQGNERAQSHLSIMTADMTSAELSEAQSQADAFRPKSSATHDSLARHDILRLFGIRGHPTEYHRFDF